MNNCCAAIMAVAGAACVTIEMGIYVARSAEQTWAAVGDYCDISE
jgi:hypothetical protein